MVFGTVLKKLHNLDCLYCWEQKITILLNQFKIVAEQQFLRKYKALLESTKLFENSENSGKHKVEGLQVNDCDVLSEFFKEFRLAWKQAVL